MLSQAYINEPFLSISYGVLSGIYHLSAKLNGFESISNDLSAERIESMSTSLLLHYPVACYESSRISDLLSASFF